MVQVQKIKVSDCHGMGWIEFSLFSFISKLRLVDVLTRRQVLRLYYGRRNNDILREDKVDCAFERCMATWNSVFSLHVLDWID